MCTHSKIIYKCNHSQTSPYTCKPCGRQQEFLSGRRTLPCDEMWTHGRNTFRVDRECDTCREKKENLDRRFHYAKSRLAELRKQLEKSVGNCAKHMKDIGMATDEEERPGSSGSTVSVTSTASSVTLVPERRNSVSSYISGKEEKHVVDPVEEFLRMKRLESDAHLMMLSS